MEGGLEGTVCGTPPHPVARYSRKGAGPAGAYVQRGWVPQAAARDQLWGQAERDWRRTTPRWGNQK